MEDLKKKINFDPSLLYYSPTSKENEEDEKSPVTSVETYNSTNRKHVCSVCGKRFFSVSALNVHMEHHPPNERSNVEKDDDNVNTNRKSQYVWDKGIKCNKSECNFIALDAVEYSKHISTCEGIRLTKAGENISFCELCDSYFSSENHFKAHSILRHPDADPDISLKEYDAKYTTVSDPVSLYVSENNSENDSDIRQTKNLGHSKYPDSSISKRKSKEIEIEESCQRNQNTNKPVGEVTAMDDMSNVTNCEKIMKEVDQQLISAEETPSSENFATENVTETSKPSELVENGKYDENEEKEASAIEPAGDAIAVEKEKSPNEQTDALTLNVNNASLHCDTKDDNSLPNNVKNTATCGGEVVEEPSLKRELPNSPVSKKSVVQDKQMNNTVVNEVVSEKSQDEKTADDMEMPQTAFEDKKMKDELKELDSKMVEIPQNNDKQQESYTNVENMMYNLFKDEGITDTPSQEHGDIRDLSDTSPAKQKESDELENQSTNVPGDITKDESDFEEFDYNRAGKKKYLKSYCRLNKNKPASNMEDKNDKVTEIEDSILEKSESTGTDDETLNKKKSSIGGKRKKTSITDIPVSELNIKERSTRTRKKLILPDFEYDSDFKTYVSDTTPKRAEVPKRSSLPKNDDSSPRKRGRPRKTPSTSLNSSDLNKSGDITDISTSSINKSTKAVKSMVESSYLNASETAMKHDIANITTIPDFGNSPDSTVLESASQDEILKDETDVKPSATTKKTSELKTAKGKKRGRPPKEEIESKTIDKRSKSPSPASVVDKPSEESIFSDVANALLSLSDSIPAKEIVAQKPTAPASEKTDPVHIIKRKKMQTVKPVESNEARVDDVEPTSTFALKNDLETELADDANEIDNDLSFNDANKFEKEKESEKNSTSLAKDISVTPGVSTQKKRGRPPKVQKGRKSNPTSQTTSVSNLPSKPKLSKSLPVDGAKKVDKLLDVKLSDRKSVFLKNKAKVQHDLKTDSNPPSTFAKKKPKVTSKSGEHSNSKFSSLLANHSIKNQEKRQTIGLYVGRPIHDISIDESIGPEVPAPSKPTLKAGVTKKKRLGRPPKSATISSDTNVKKPDDASTSPEKELNSNESKNSRKSREDSPFVYESYHPKKKRPRLDSDTNKDSEKGASTSKTEENAVPKKVARVAKPKKTPRPPPVEVPDETRSIDESLYLEDVNNRSKYGKSFKKVKMFIYDEKYTDDMIINCGRCKKKMTFRHYKNYHQISHYYICWIEGDPEINLQDDSEVVRVLQSSITPEALKKKAIRLACEKCNDVRKSVVGYVSHVRFCQKEDKDSLFETCKLCGRALRPSSVRYHYIKFHGTYKTSKGGMCFSTENDFFDTSQDAQEDSDETGTPAIKRLRIGFTRSELQKKDIIEDDEFWNELKTPCDLYMCMGLSCRHMTISKEELKSHVLDCLSRFCEFSCSSCSYKTRYENEIIYHSKKNCSSDANVDKEKPVETGRRVSTRVKTVNYKYGDAQDLNDFSDEDVKRRDRDFEVVDEKSDDEEYADSDMELEKAPLRKSLPRRKKVERVLTTTSVTDKLGLRNAFQQYCTGRTDPLRWTVDLRLKVFSSTPLHVHMKVNAKEWEVLPTSETEKYIPVQKKSMKTYFDTGSSSQFNLFQADVIKGVPLCFVGGPVWAMAWAPIPAHVTEQYLAVSTLQHMNHLVGMQDSVSFPSLIQFWKFSSIDNISNDIQKPILGWSIAHPYGAIWSLEWCPSGGFNNLSTTSRLGILAAATSSGCVIVYNVPKLEISDKEPGECVTNPKPDLILKIRNENVQCTRIVWDQISPHNSLIGGFSDGSISFWNINTASLLLKKGNVVYPYRTFEAHNSSITALDLHWLNNSRFLITSSTDRVTRLWDLTDLSGPINEYERPTPAMSAIWMQHWIVTANAHDFGNLVGESGAFIAHPRDPFEKKKTLVNVKDAFWSLSYSLWNDTLAVSSNGGYVSAYAAKHLSMLTYKSPEFDKIITSTELVDLNDREKEDFSTDEFIATIPSVNDVFDCTAMIKNKGVRFLDRAKSNMNTDALSFDADKCNPTSVNKVCWNQNYNSFNWLAIGYECGFVRVVRVERFDKHYLTKFYKTNENTATLM